MKLRSFLDLLALLAIAYGSIAHPLNNNTKVFAESLCQVFKISIEFSCVAPKSWTLLEDEIPKESPHPITPLEHFTIFPILRLNSGISTSLNYSAVTIRLPSKYSHELYSYSAMILNKYIFYHKIQQIKN